MNDSYNAPVNLGVIDPNTDSGFSVEFVTWARNTLGYVPKLQYNYFYHTIGDGPDTPSLIFSNNDDIVQYLLSWCVPSENTGVILGNWWINRIKIALTAFDLEHRPGAYWR